MEVGIHPTLHQVGHLGIRERRRALNRTWRDLEWHQHGGIGAGCCRAVQVRGGGGTCEAALVVPVPSDVLAGTSVAAFMVAVNCTVSAIAPAGTKQAKPNRSNERYILALPCASSNYGLFSDDGNKAGANPGAAPWLTWPWHAS